MSARFDDLRVLRAAEQIADEVWKEILHWDHFACDVVGKQLARAADSIGANIAESYGRYHFRDKVQFLYFARGSLFETKYWLNRAVARGLVSAEQARERSSQLTEIARQLNAFANTLKSALNDGAKAERTVRESEDVYAVGDAAQEYDLSLDADEFLSGS